MKQIVVFTTILLIYTDYNILAQKRNQGHFRKTTSSLDCPLLSPPDSVIVYFTLGSSRFTPTTFRKLHCLAKNHQQPSQTKFVVTGAGGGNYEEQQRSWEQVYNVIEYLHDSSGQKYSNFIFRYNGDARLNTVEIRFARPNETGDSTVPPPAPQRSFRTLHY